jgi:hypothetical protein
LHNYISPHELILIIVFLISNILLPFAVFAKKKIISIYLIVVILFFNNNPIVVNFFYKTFAFGTPIFFIFYISLFLVILFPIDCRRILKSSLNFRGVLLILCMILVGISLLNSINFIASLKSLIFLISTIFIGWFMFGNAARHWLDPRRLLISITDMYGFLNLCIVLISILLVGPMVMRGEVGGAESIFNLFGISTYRLQAERLNATGVGAASAISALWLFSVYQRVPRSLVYKLLVTFLLFLSLIGLFWSASRGAIVSFFATLIASIFLFNKFRYSKDYFKFLLSVFVFTTVIILIFINYFYDMMYRNIDKDEVNSLFTVFLQSRIELYGPEIYSFLKPTFFGIGYGVLATGNEGINIESFPLKVYIELGIISGSIYIITFILISYCVVKVDRFYHKIGESGSFFPSSVFFFIWFNSISSWGFALPLGTLAIYLSIASVANFIVFYSPHRKNFFYNVTVY